MISLKDPQKLDFYALKVNIYMRAPNNQPTEKTKKRLEREQQLPSKSPSVSMDVQELMQIILDDEKVQKEVTRRLDSQEAIETLTSIMTEYLESFMLIGYDIDGEPVIIKHTNTTRDENGVIELMRCVFLSFIKGEQ